MKTPTALLTSLLTVLSHGALQADPVQPAPPPTVITNPAHLLSADDLKAITTAASVYLEGDEVIFSITALNRDTVRVNIGMYYNPSRSHGMKFTLHRAKDGWIEDRKDKTERWNQ